MNVSKQDEELAELHLPCNPLSGTPFNKEQSMTCYMMDLVELHDTHQYALNN
jgi:hypothetical protein